MLRVKVNEPPEVDPFSRDLPEAGPAGTQYDPYGQDSETIILTNYQRLHQYYSTYDEANGVYTDTSAVDALIAQRHAGIFVVVDGLGEGIACQIHTFGL